MLHHRQSNINVDPEIFNMAFEGNVITANSQVVILWHADLSARSNQKSFSLVIVQLQPITSCLSPKRANALLSVNIQWTKVRWGWRLVKLSIISGFVMTAPTLRNDFRRWLNAQGKEYWAQGRTLRKMQTPAQPQKNRQIGKKNI